MDSKQTPRSFFVLESAPTSEDEFSAIIVPQETPQPLNRVPSRQPIFQAVRTEFTDTAEETTAIRSLESRTKRSRVSEEKSDERCDSVDSLQRIFEEDDAPKPSKPPKPRTPVKKAKVPQAGKAGKHPLTNIEALKLELDSLETNFPLEGIETLITCELCEGFMRHPQCMLECMHTCEGYVVCKVCAFTWMIETNNINKCPTCLSPVTASTYCFLSPNLLLESVITKLVHSRKTEASLRLPLAQKVMNSIGYYTRDKVLQMQRLLLGGDRTVAFQVQLE